MLTAFADVKRGGLLAPHVPVRTLEAELAAEEKSALFKRPVVFTVTDRTPTFVYTSEPT